MATKNKGGRPRRAAGEVLKKLSISIRPTAFECLEILARERRTSVSQVIEFLALAAGREAAVDGVSVLAIADQMANCDDSGKGRLRRAQLMPVSLRTPEEQFIASMLSEIDDYSKCEEEEALILFEVASDVFGTGGGTGFAVSVWREACKAWRAKQDTFSVEDNDGLVYEYDLKVASPQKEGYQLVKTSREALLRPLMIVQGVVDRVHSPPRNGPVPLPRKARPKKT